MTLCSIFDTMKVTLPLTLRHNFYFILRTKIKITQGERGMNYSLPEKYRISLLRSVYVYPGLPARQTTPDAVVSRALRSLGEAWE